jgi:hypothetical protein
MMILTTYWRDYMPATDFYEEVEIGHCSITLFMMSVFWSRTSGSDVRRIHMRWKKSTKQERFKAKMLLGIAEGISDLIWRKSLFVSHICITYCSKLAKRL